MELQRARILWSVWLLLLILSAYAVPYLFLTAVNRVYGAVLFWILFALTAIGSIFAITAQWRDE